MMARPGETRFDGFGIDFGTTNSVVAVSTRSHPTPRTRALLTEGKPHPSVIWYQVSQEPRVGRQAKNNILGFSEAPGNLFISSVKRSMGKDRSFAVFNSKYHARQVGSEIFKHLKADASANHGIELASAVVTIPVDFDGRARRDIREAANQAGIHIKTFVHEPFAAIVGYCYSEKGIRKLEDREGETILVFDWGGGTLDITIGRIEGGTISELSTSGIADRSGDHFDEILANFAKSEFLERNGISAERFALQPSTRDRLRVECELRKIDLSEEDDASISLNRFFQDEGRVYDIEEYVTREKFEELIDLDVTEAVRRVDHALEAAGLRPSDIDLALLIGGTSRIPRVRKEMRDRFGTRMVEVENADSIIAEGAAIVDALDLHPVLARPICIQLSDGSHYEVFKAGALAKEEVCSKEVALFCTDNRDGQARLIVVEGSGAFKDRYTPKSVITLPVSPTLPKPYNHERVITRFVIDQDLVLRVSARAATQASGSEAEVYDLCFALKSFGDP